MNPPSVCSQRYLDGDACVKHRCVEHKHSRRISVIKVSCIRVDLSQDKEIKLCQNRKRERRLLFVPGGRAVPLSLESEERVSVSRRTTAVIGRDVTAYRHVSQTKKLSGCFGRHLALSNERSARVVEKKFFFSSTKKRKQQKLSSFTPMMG